MADHDEEPGDDREELARLDVRLLGNRDRERGAELVEATIVGRIRAGLAAHARQAEVLIALVRLDVPVRGGSFWDRQSRVMIAHLVAERAVSVTLLRASCLPEVITLLGEATRMIDDRERDGV